MKNSEHKIIVNYLYDLRKWSEGWVLAGKIRSISTPYGFIGFRGDRNVRDLVKMGILERRMNGKFAEVRYKVHPKVEAQTEDARIQADYMRASGYNY